ncbi:MAG TPA: BON domain-containing protein, partial [Steroidobacteraceae bacterium]
DTEIAVKVTGNEITLSGFVRDYYQKYQAEIAVRRIKGAAAVANDIQIKPPGAGLTDPELERAALAALQSELPITWEQIKPSVKDGRIALTGCVEWHYQRERAECAIRMLNGVVSVRNSIEVKTTLQPENIKHKIEDAFRRLAQIDANRVEVQASRASPGSSIN